MGVALVKALFTVPCGTTDQGQRSFFEMRQDPGGDLFIVKREITLGNALFGIKDTIGMGEIYTGYSNRSWRSGSSRCWVGRGFFVGDLVCRFVVAQTFERRMAQNPILGPAGKRNLADQVGLHPMYSLSGASPGRIRKWCSFNCAAV